VSISDTGPKQAAAAEAIVAAVDAAVSQSRDHPHEPAAAQEPRGDERKHAVTVTSAVDHDFLEPPRTRERRDSNATVSTMRTHTSASHGGASSGRTQLEEIVARRRALAHGYVLLQQALLVVDRFLQSHVRKVIYVALFVTAFSFPSWTGFCLLIFMYFTAAAPSRLLHYAGMLNVMHLYCSEKY